MATKTIKFDCGRPIGEDPDVCAEIVWQLVKDGPGLKLKSLTLNKDSVEVEVEAATDLEASALGARAVESISVGANRGRMRGLDVRVRNGKGG